MKGSGTYVQLLATVAASTEPIFPGPDDLRAPTLAMHFLSMANSTSR